MTKMTFEEWVEWRVEEQLRDNNRRLMMISRLSRNASEATESTMLEIIETARKCGFSDDWIAEKTAPLIQTVPLIQNVGAETQKIIGAKLG